MPGADVVAFVIGESGSIDGIEFVEVKYRTRPSTDIAVTAHEQLTEARKLDFATTINFLAHRLQESDPDLYGTYMAFLRKRDARDNLHTIALCLEATNWSNAIAENLDELAEHLPELKFRILPFESAVTLIDEIYAELGWSVTEDD